MPNVLLRNLDPELLARLKDRARRHGRSLQAELKVILAAAVPKTLSWEEFSERSDRLRADILRSRGGVLMPDSADLIREDRDR